MQLLYVASQTMPPKGLQHQKSETTTDQFQETQTENGLVLFLKISKNCHNEIKETDNHTIVTLNGDDKKSSLPKRIASNEKNISGRRTNK